MGYFTYILFSEKLCKYYVGSTQDLGNRINEHNCGESKYTKPGVPWNLVKYYKSDTRSEALKIENRIKKRGIKRFLEAN